ncbi:MAG: hypothetical protein IT201_13510 [Thermoleophilia bacterium]|nr:hypothetical protein [Thermoleophilia bacterium]
MRALGLAIILPALVAVATACGSEAGGSGAAVVETITADTGTEPAPAGSIRALLAERPGADVALVLGSSDFVPGANRISFLVLRPDGRVVHAPRARVAVAAGDLDAVPAIEGTAEDLDVGTPGKDDDELESPSVWVARVDLPAPGRYTLLVEPEGTDVQAVGQIEVRASSPAPEIGDPAFPSDTPTLEDGFAEEITTASPPDVELLRHSVADSLEDGVPFVVVFATPRYCQSRVCGPAVAVVDEVRRRLEGGGVRFIHVEIYEGNDPARGFNRWVEEWGLPTEPYTFLVGADGIVAARFEGLVTVGELERAVRELLL